MTLKRFKFLRQQLSSSRTQSASAGVGPETELSNYAAEMCSGTVLNCSAIVFWQAHEAGYPLLSKIAIDRISAPASQAYAELAYDDESSSYAHSTYACDAGADDNDDDDSQQVTPCLCCILPYCCC